MAQNLLDEILKLNKSKVHIKNPDKVNEKLRGIVEGGFSQLQIVSDFDQTITKQHEDGRCFISSFRMFEQCPSLTLEYKETTEKLMKHYHPKEYDPSIPEDEKRILMEEWWHKSEQALHGLTVTSEEIDRVVAQLNPSMRDGTDALFEILLKNDVPVLVFSAGLGDTVVSVLKHNKVYFKNLKVISNFVNYNENGVISGFQGPTIHVLNKNEVAIKNTDYYDVIKNRCNVILLGDSLGDGNMADGMDHANHVLKIGFLFEKIEGNLPRYMDTFDIVLEDDQTMDVVRAIINKMT